MQFHVCIQSVNILEETGMLKYFDVVSGATLDKTLDTKPAIIGLSLQRLGVAEEDLEHVFMVGDRDMDIIGAHENKITGIGALYGYGGEEELKNAGADITETVLNAEEAARVIGNAIG